MKKFSKEDLICTLIEREEVVPKVWRFRFENLTIASQATPGQFVHIQVSEETGLDPILRRPISISSASSKEGWFEIFFREVGRGTEQMAGFEIGKKVSALGPLGQGFSQKGERPLLIGGGMGIAPLIFQSQRMSDKFQCMALGGRTQSEVFWDKYFCDTASQIYVATDDGSVGQQGSVVTLLTGKEKEFDYIYTCGPEGLMKAVATWAKEHNIPCEVSMEKHMACGVGVCLSCGCSTSSGRKKVCQNGPVFNAEEVFNYE